MSKGCGEPIRVVPSEATTRYSMPMRAVVQRVTQAEVRVSGELVGSIGAGLCVFVGVGRDDGDTDVAALADKIVGLRIFEDDAAKMNRSVKDVGGAVLAISQFTLHGDARRGKRPSFTDAMEPGQANQLFEALCEAVRVRGVHVERGRFRAHMVVNLTNDGPVTILLDTQKTF